MHQCCGSGRGEGGSGGSACQRRFSVGCPDARIACCSSPNALGGSLQGSLEEDPSQKILGTLLASNLASRGPGRRAP